MNAYPIKFIPVTSERIWGGDKLKSWFHANTDRPIGEYWVVSGHPNGTSVAANGSLAGKTLGELTELYPQAYLGNSPQKRFPLLVKFLEADDDLSVQIHPDDAYAQKHEGDLGKTEAWYILDHKPGGEILYGDSFESREQYLQAVAENDTQRYYKREKIAKDQIVFVPARTMHALLAGTVLIEIQQTSDVTYRVYDWDRKDAKGVGRELHIEKAADVMLYGQPSPVKADTNRRMIVQSPTFNHEHLVTCPYFTIEKMAVSGGFYALANGKAGNPDILVVADGEGTLEYYEGEISLQRGDAVLVPGTLKGYRIRSEQGITLLRSYY